MFADDDAPPTYELDDDHPLPVYSTQAGSSECLLQMEAPRMTGCPACDFIFETKHMKINLGSRVWGLQAPSYGLDGKVEGLIKFSGDQDRVESVTAILEGRLRTTLAHRGSMSGESVWPLLTQSTLVYHASMANTFQWDQEHPFSIPIPRQAKVRDRLRSTPPSYYSLHQNVCCEVTYSVRFQMTRKGKGLKKNESKTVEILYLPKSRPSEPPVTAIPRPSRTRGDVSSFLHMFERVKTLRVSPYRPSELKDKIGLDSFENRVYLSLPDPQCFTSGQIVPFTLSLVFPDDPVLSQLLTRNIRIQLLKRTLVWRKGLSEVIQRDLLVTSASLRYGREYMEGISLLRGEIRAGEAGREASWKLDELAEVQYVLRIILRPPDNLVGHVPSYRHEEVFQLATDSWGTLDRELTSTGGTPTPAVGLVAGLRRADI